MAQVHHQLLGASIQKSSRPDHVPQIEDHIHTLIVSNATEGSSSIKTNCCPPSARIERSSIKTTNAVYI